MFPDFQYVFNYFFGIDIPGLSIAKTFGFFVAMAFVLGAIVLSKELKRKHEEGLIEPTIAPKKINQPITSGAILLQGLLGFLLGYKIIGLFTDASTASADPMSYIMSSKGHLLAGVIGGLIFGFLKYQEKNKLKGKKEETVNVKTYPHQRVADILIVAAIAGFAGAKIFNAFETWEDFVSNPIESLFSGSGLTFYGGLIVATIALYYYSKKINLSFKHLCDAVAPTLILAYGIGRLGCQFAGDGDWGVYNSAYITQADGQLAKAAPGDFEKLVVQLPEMSREFGNDPTAVPHIYAPANVLPQWMVAQNYPNNVNREGVKLPNFNGHYNTVLPAGVFPTPIYEFFACLLIFGILMAVRKKFKYPMQLFGLYLIFNGLERFLVEKIRVNYKYDWGFIHPSQAEIISTILILIGIYLLLFNPFKRTTKVAGS